MFSKVAQWLILAVAVGLFCVGSWLAINDKTASAALMLAAAVLCLIFVYLARFKRFKGLGIEAELWEDKQREAEQLIERLKPLALGVAKPLIIMTARMGRWGSAFTRQERLDAMKNLDRLLSEAGLTSQQIAEAKSEHDRYVQIDMARPIIQGITKRISERIDELVRSINAYQQPIQANDEVWRRLVESQNRAMAERKSLQQLYGSQPIEAMADRIRQFVNTADSLTDGQKAEILREHEDELVDLAHYAKHKKIRRLEVWLAQNE